MYGAYIHELYVFICQLLQSLHVPCMYTGDHRKQRGRGMYVRLYVLQDVLRTSCLH